MLCILRNPVDRAYSAYMYMVSLTRESESDFARAWAAEPRRLEENYHHIWHYRQMGLYSEQVGAFMEAFPVEQLKVLIYDDFRARPLEIVRECFEFLGIDADFVPPRAPRPLVSGRPKNYLLQAAMGRPSVWRRMAGAMLPRSLTRKVRDTLARKNLEREPMSEAMRAQLLEFYREDVARLSQLLGRDLSGWNR